MRGARVWGIPHKQPVPVEAEYVLGDEQDDRVIGWRMECLEEAGYTQDEAQLISVRRDIDLHLACDLVKKRGWPSSYATRLLL